MMQEGCIKDEPTHLDAGASLGQGQGTYEFLVLFVLPRLITSDYACRLHVFSITCSLHVIDTVHGVCTTFIRHPARG